MDIREEQLIEFFKKSGANEEQARVMSRQMVRRATQLATERGWSEVQAMQHLLKLFLEARGQ
ncbi:MAG: hypothetical protein KJT03_22840 [Verrucomicrobiae bacterium]|nr:hypothetical protein [Verrucomicrobiae bacterium]